MTAEDCAQLHLGAGRQRRAAQQLGVAKHCQRRLQPAVRAQHPNADVGLHEGPRRRAADAAPAIHSATADAVASESGEAEERELLRDGGRPPFGRPASPNGRRFRPIAASC